MLWRAWTGRRLDHQGVHYQVSGADWPRRCPAPRTSTSAVPPPPPSGWPPPRWTPT
ncbi:hypothetical protein AB0B56_23345 [Streptosporangium canum]|uniref:hypothetical protein n=1 Tax=Streptosporangium canum TaxID=324952 RepID=UPI003448DBD5